MTAQPQRIAVLGATGHIGQAVVRHALDNGRQVTALSRRSDPPELRGLPVKLQRIDAGARIPGRRGGGSRFADRRGCTVSARSFSARHAGHGARKWKPLFCTPNG